MLELPEDARPMKSVGFFQEFLTPCCKSFEEIWETSICCKSFEEI
jgi:hypothetical protein